MPVKDTKAFFQEMFEDMALKYPQKLALDFIDQQGKEIKYDYARLNQAVNKWVEYFATQGIKQDDIVGVVTESPEKSIILFLAILKSGATFAPLPVFEGNVKATEIRRHRLQLNNYLDNIKPNFILSSQAQLRYLGNRRQILTIDNATTQLAIDAIDKTANPIQRIPKWAYILGTSGSTGRPKFVRTGPHALVSRVVAHRDRMRLNTDDRVIQLFPLTFDASLMEITMALGSGACICPAPSRRLGDDVIKFCKEKNITAGIFFPKAVNWLYTTGIKKIVCMGDKGDYPALINQLKNNANLKIYIGYGVAEVTIAATLGEFTLNSREVVLGQPVDGVTLRVYQRGDNDKAANENHLICEMTSTQNLPILANPQQGELYIADDNDGVGEYLEAELNTEKFSIIDGKKFYKSGDCVTIMPGEGLVFVRRYTRSYKSDEVRWVHPDFMQKEITKILRTVSSIPADEMMVIAERNSANNLTAALFIAPHHKFDADDLRKVHQALLQDLHPDMLPSVPVHWAILKEEIPDAERLKSILNDIKTSKLNTLLVPAKSTSFPAEHLSNEEKRLVDLWKEVLEIKEDISVQHLFYEELNATSLEYHAMEHKVLQLYAVRINEVEFRKHQTIAYLARYIRFNINDKVNAATLVPINKSANENSVSEQLPLFLIHGGDGGISAYHNYVNNELFDNRAVYAIRSPGMNSISDVADSVEETADYYAKLIRRQLSKFKHQNECVIAGWSAGGIIGVEVRYLLKTKYNIDAKLFLIDSRAPNYWHNISRETFNTQLRGFIQHLFNVRNKSDALLNFQKVLDESLFSVHESEPQQQIDYAINVVLMNVTLMDEFKNKLVTALKTAKAISVDYEMVSDVVFSIRDTTIFVISETEIDFMKTYIIPQTEYSTPDMRVANIFRQFAMTGSGPKPDTVLGWDISGSSPNVVRIGYSMQTKGNDLTHINVIFNPEFMQRFSDKLKEKDSQNITSLTQQAMLVPIFEARSLYFLDFDCFDNDPESETNQANEYKKQINILLDNKDKIQAQHYQAIIRAIKKITLAIDDYRSGDYEKQINSLSLVKAAISDVMESVETNGSSFYSSFALFAMFNLRALLYRALRNPEDAFFDFTQACHFWKKIKSTSLSAAGSLTNLNKAIGTIYCNIGHLSDEISTATRIYTPPRLQLKRFIDNYLKKCDVANIDSLIPDNADKYSFFTDEGMRFHRLARALRGADLFTEHSVAYSLSSKTFYWHRIVSATSGYLREHITLRVTHPAIDLSEIENDLDQLGERTLVAYDAAMKMSNNVIARLSDRGMRDTTKLPLRFLLHQARLHKHGGRYQKSLKIYDSMISGTQANANVLLELRRERAEVTYLLATGSDVSEEKRRSLEDAKAELEVYVRHQNDYHKKMMAVLVTDEGKNILDEIEANYVDARAKLSDIIRQLKLSKDLPKESPREFIDYEWDKAIKSLETAIDSKNAAKTFRKIVAKTETKIETPAPRRIVSKL